MAALLLFVLLFVLPIIVSALLYRIDGTGPNAGTFTLNLASNLTNGRTNHLRTDSEALVEEIRVLAAAGHDPDSVVRLQPGDCHSRDGERVGEQLLTDRDRLPGAVFCQSDELAFGLIASLRRGGVLCPRDISVAGFDDHPMSHLWDLTTVDQHAYAQGRRAAGALLEILGDTKPNPVLRSEDLERLRVELVVRDSTAPSGTRR